MIRGLTYYWDDGANLGKGVIEFATLRPQPLSSTRRTDWRVYG